MRVKSNKASEMIEYLLMFAVVVTVVLGSSRLIGKKSGEILGDAIDDLSDPIYTYAWSPGDCAPCPVSCGGGQSVCTFVCKRSDDKVVANALCVSAPPAAQLMDCNIQPCPIDCVWNPWPNCTANPAASGCGACTPACSDSLTSTRTVTREVLTEAQYGGTPCNSADGVRVEACSVPACTGYCGDGILTAGEQCDGGDLGIYGGGSCNNANVLALGVPNAYVSGTISCYPPGAANECQINVSQCEYDNCTAFSVPVAAPAGCGVNASCIDSPVNCTAGHCDDGTLLYTRTCQRLKMDGTVLNHSLVQSHEDECRNDSRCNFNCLLKDNLASACSGWNERLTQDNQPWTYVAQSNCPAYPATCTAECPTDPNGRLLVESSGCNCQGGSSWDGNSCECINGQIWNGSNCIDDTVLIADPCYTYTFSSTRCVSGCGRDEVPVMETVYTPISMVIAHCDATTANAICRYYGYPNGVVSYNVETSGYDAVWANHHCGGTVCRALGGTGTLALGSCGDWPDWGFCKDVKCRK